MAILLIYSWFVAGSHDTVMKILRTKHLRLILYCLLLLLLFQHFRNNAIIRQGLKMNQLFIAQNFVKFFKELKCLSPLSQCSLLIHLDNLKRWQLSYLIIYLIIILGMP